MKILTKENLIRKNMFHRTTEESREFMRENEIQLLKLLIYMRKRNDKKIQKGNCA